MTVSDFERQESHPSWATAQFSRISGHTNLFQTTIDGGSFITLTIRRASRDRGLSNYWVYGSEELIRVAMSNNQFANLITTMNMGSGEPCTIRHWQGESVPEPERDHPREAIDREFEKECAEVHRRSAEVLDKIREIFSKPSVNKADRERVIGLVSGMILPLVDSMPFIQKQFTEAMDGVVTEAKSEIDAFVEAKVRSLGIEKLDEVVKALSAPSESIRPQNASRTLSCLRPSHSFALARRFDVSPSWPRAIRASGNYAVLDGRRWSASSQKQSETF